MSIDWSERISSRVTQLLSEQHGDRIFPLLCLDECCNNQRVYDMVKALMVKGLAAGSTDLWYQWRQRENGERCMVRGSLPTGSEIPGFDVGRLIDGQGWEDARVVDLLITEFLGHSHLVLLTADKRKKGLSLRSLLHQHVKPALESNHGDRYSLTVIYKNPKTDIPRYCRAVEELLGNRQYVPGYHEHSV